MNIQRKNSAHHFRMQSEREQTLVFINVVFRSEQKGVWGTLLWNETK